MYKKIVKYMAYLRDKRRAKDSNLRWNLEHKIEKLNSLVEVRLRLLQFLMKEYGINGLPADMKEREELLKKYPDLHDVYNKLYDAANEAGRITMANPWLWKPGEDVGNYYDIGAVQDRMIAIVNAEEEYTNYLDQRNTELETKLKDSPDNQDLINEQIYNMCLIEDLLATTGDKMIDVWWNAIPRIIKEKYTKYMDDLMICALGSNELLSGVAKEYNKLKGEQKEEICAAFITVLVHDLNETVFTDKPININVYSNHNEMRAGSNIKYNQESLVNFNVANIGKKVDQMVGTLKHEILGHYVDDFYSNIGLQGEAMRNFVSGSNIVSYGSEIFCHGHVDVEPGFIVVSPLLKQEYQMPQLNGLDDEDLEEVVNILYKNGWQLAHYYGREVNRDYKNIMTERSAWLIDNQTKNVVRKIDAYRAARGLPRIGSVEVVKRSIER